MRYAIFAVNLRIALPSSDVLVRGIIPSVVTFVEQSNAMYSIWRFTAAARSALP
jgi:hypothetical protein